MTSCSIGSFTSLKETIHESSPKATISNAKIIIILELHHDERYQDLEAKILKEYYAENSLVLLEAATGTRKFRLIKEKIARKADITFCAEGWGEPNNQKWLDEEYAPVNNLMKECLPKLKTPEKFTVEAVENRIRHIERYMLPGKVAKDTSPKKLAALAENKFNKWSDEALDTSMRIDQKYLVDKIKNCYEKFHKLFIIMGALHYTKDFDEKYNDLYQELHDALKGKSYVVIQPENATSDEDNPKDESWMTTIHKTVLACFHWLRNLLD
ncbi:MAG: hypothetical protein H7A37_04175 [Chlamydiales bacterium]|nr:hypothetical protein [Chlamydiia bacterium]MCP5507483.1 hypothetical protein [Chlamydiales bacterium]